MTNHKIGDGDDDNNNNPAFSGRVHSTTNNVFLSDTHTCNERIP